MVRAADDRIPYHDRAAGDSTLQWSSMPIGVMEKVLGWTRCVDLPQLAAASPSLARSFDEGFWLRRLHDALRNAEIAEEMPLGEANHVVTHRCRNTMRWHIAMLEARAIHGILERDELDRQLLEATRTWEECWPLLMVGASVYSQVCGVTALGSAVMHGNTAAVKSLIAAGADMEIPDNIGDSPLANAIASGQTDVLEVMLNDHVCLDSLTVAGDPLLTAAILHKQVALASWLIQRGANLEARDSEGDTPLLCAVSSHDAPWSKGSDDGGVSPSTELVQVLVDAGANLEQVNAEMLTPLLCAAGKGYVAAVELLIARGASIEATDPDGNTALIRAVMASNAEMEQVLLLGGARCWHEIDGAVDGEVDSLENENPDSRTDSRASVCAKSSDTTLAMNWPLARELTRLIRWKTFFCMLLIILCSLLA